MNGFDIEELGSESVLDRLLEQSNPIQMEKEKEIIDKQMDKEKVTIDKQMEKEKEIIDQPIWGSAEAIEMFDLIYAHKLQDQEQEEQIYLTDLLLAEELQKLENSLQRSNFYSSYPSQSPKPEKEFELSIEKQVEIQMEEKNRYLVSNLSYTNQKSERVSLFSIPNEHKKEKEEPNQFGSGIDYSERYKIFNKMDDKGMTPLMWACQNSVDDNNKTEILELLDKNSDPFLENKQGQSALDLVQINHNPESFNLVKFYREQIYKNNQDNVKKYFLL